MPTLILWGEADQLIPVEQAEVWARRRHEPWDGKARA